MAKRKTTATAADQGDAYEPQADEAAKVEFPPADGPATPGIAGEPAPKADPRPTWAEKTQCLTDPQAGVRFTFDHANHTGQITFDEKPSPEVRRHLKDQGYHWHREHGAWCHPIDYANRVRDRLHAKKAYHQVCAMIRQEKGIEPPSQQL